MEGDPLSTKQLTKVQMGKNKNGRNLWTLIMECNFNVYPNQMSNNLKCGRAFKKTLFITNFVSIRLLNIC
jgi:hypothetical protein